MPRRFEQGFKNGKVTYKWQQKINSKNKMQTFFKYFGGKYRLALKYPAPRFDLIVEPFAGAAGYSIKYFNKEVVLCDLDPEIVALWRYLIGVSSEEIMKLPILRADERISEYNLIPEAKLLLSRWVQVSHRTSDMSSVWMRSAMFFTPFQDVFWNESIRERIARQVNYIRHWKIYECSYEDCPISGPATWFVDPPYEIMGKYYEFGSDRIDYAHLGDWCRTRKGQVIACENEGANWLPFRFLTKNFGGCIQNGKAKISIECVWLNDEDDE